LGKILSSDTLGAVTLTANINSLLPRDSLALTEGTMKLNIKEIQLLQYAYTDFNLDGSFVNQHYEGTASIADSNLAFNLSADVNLSDSIPEFQVSLNLLGADFNALHLTRDDFSARGMIHANIKGSNLNNANGYVTINNLLLLKNGEEFRHDSIYASVENASDTVKLLVESETIEANYNGTVKLSDLGLTMTRFINQYVYLSDTLQPVSGNQQFEFDVRVFDTELISEIVLPEVEDFLPGHISARFNAAKNDFEFNVNFPHIKYNNLLVDSLILDVQTTDTNSLSYSLRYEQIGSEPFMVGRTLFEGAADSNVFNFDLQIQDDEEEEKYNFRGHISNEDQLTIHIDPDPLILNYNPFTIPEDNMIVIGDQTVEYQQFSNAVRVSENHRN
jgi:translocation and assembly module TamB